MRLIALSAAVVCSAGGAEWRQFRGPNGSGVAPETGLPVSFGAGQNLVWRTALAPGYSSPVVTRDRVFVTAHEGPTLFTICLDRDSGKVLWRRESPKHLAEKPKGPNSPVSPSPATDGRNVYVLFDVFGLISYGPDGEERWRLPLAPFNTPYGFGSSPVLEGDTLLLLADQDSGSYLLAVHKDTGKTIWRRERPEATHGFPSPVVYRPAGGAAQIIVSGAFQVAGYSLANGEKLWWVNGLGWQAKSMPVIGDGVVYVHSWMASMTELGTQPAPPWLELLAKHDADKDGKLSPEETPDPEIKKLWFLFDLDKDNFLTDYDWSFHRARHAAQNGLYAIRPGGRGDLTASHVLWRYDKSLPNIPSPLLYQGVLYVLREGGILTSLDPASGRVLKQGRVEGAVGAYFASPVAADGKLYLVSKDGKAAVVKAAGEWDVLKVNDLAEETWATPAIADGRIYLRTQQALYCFEVTRKPV